MFELTDKQKSAVKSVLSLKLMPIISDTVNRTLFIYNIEKDVIEDIEETADWSDFAEDEVHIGDIEIALARVLLNLSEIGK